jgi:hypothetical protein
MASSVQMYSEAEREYERMMIRARTYTKVAGLKKEIATNPDAVVAIMWTLTDYGLQPTIPAVNMAFDWIEGRAEPSAMLYVAVARQHGYQVEPVVRTNEKAVARVSSLRVANFRPIEVEFTLKDAADSHRLDEWVERWQESRQGRNYPQRQVVMVNGRPVENLPDWAANLMNSGQVKRYDAWWNYRTDMLWKSAAKRAVKVACPHVLLGGSDGEADWQAPPGRFEPSGPVIDAQALEAVHDDAPESRGFVDEDGVVE